MKDVLEAIAQITEPMAVATIVATWSSAPRQPGAALVVTTGGAVIGSISLGCIESDIYVRCQEVLESGQAALITYGVSDDDALAVGMTCGGVMTVLVDRIDPRQLRLPVLAQHVRAREAAALVTAIDGPHAGNRRVITAGASWGTLGTEELDTAAAAAVARARGANTPAGTTALERHAAEPVPVFIELITPPPHMVICGAVEFAAALAEVAAVLGYRVTVCDARAVFATPERFPAAHEVVVAWPHKYLKSLAVDENTAICVLTHDAKFDEPLLVAAVRSRAGYIGAMGSRRTHDDRTARLRARGLTEQELSRISSPIGLDLGALTPAETAVSIVAEIISLRTGRGGGALSQERGPLHDRHHEPAAYQAAETVTACPLTE